ncbi:MAG: LysM peptidoglycan-binding domain-containing protein [Spirochaetaceae bacterium]|jgi:tetratricopeptide (TPR) repeat protein|nr:LysM peptidoglycan-binding domain-containing protein [Spirochaetaceae bacterium]
MNKRRHLAGLAVLLFGLGIAPFSGAQEEPPVSEFVDSLLKNQYLLESLRLIGLAEECYAKGEYDDAIRYAEEAMRYSERSDIYVTLQIKIKKANDAIAAAKKRLEWAAGVGAARRYAQQYEEAQYTYEDALDARSVEAWDEAREYALEVIKILALVKEQPSLPAQYLVRTWNPTKDCLWNIAAKPQIYGDPFKWVILYEANKDKLTEPNNPDLIHPGMILDIPSINGEVRSGIWEEWEEIEMLNR